MRAKCLRSYKVPTSTLILSYPSHLSCLGRPSSHPCCDPRFFSGGTGPGSPPRATRGMASVILSAWGGARVLTDSRAPSRQRESTCSEVFRAWMERQAPRSLQINELHNIPPLFLPEIAPTVQSQGGGAFRGVSQGGGDRSSHGSSYQHF